VDLMLTRREVAGCERPRWPELRIHPRSTTLSFETRISPSATD
jgi:hypothetical protein